MENTGFQHLIKAAVYNFSSSWHFSHIPKMYYFCNQVGKELSNTALSSPSCYCWWTAGATQRFPRLPVMFPQREKESSVSQTTEGRKLKKSSSSISVTICDANMATTSVIFEFGGKKIKALFSSHHIFERDFLYTCKEAQCIIYYSKNHNLPCAIPEMKGTWNYMNVKRTGSLLLPSGQHGASLYSGLIQLSLPRCCSRFLILHLWLPLQTKPAPLRSGGRLNSFHLR